jgi:LPPG:FO 2-phospho-L-lactate transferase
LIAVIAGGTGSIKLIRGLAKSVKDLVVISNVADNIWLHGMYVCPDLDTVLYGLGNILDRANGWGIKQDSYSFLKQLAILGAPIWFKLGDKDLATHVLRTKLLKEGKNLTQITDFLRRKFNVLPRIIPVSNDHMETRLMTDGGDLHIQEFWVREKGRPTIRSIRYSGCSNVKVNPIAIDALQKSRAIVIAPANPISSIGPMLSLKEFRSELRSMREKIVAISPIIGNRVISGPAEKYMKCMNVEVSPLGVAKHYRTILGKFIISESDDQIVEKISKFNICVHCTNIIMKSRTEENSLANYILTHCLQH